MSIQDLGMDIEKSAENKVSPTTSSFIEGVNYGNRFIPEPWMAADADSIYKSPKYGPEVIKPHHLSDLSFCDITDDRILRYLDDNVKEEHFKKMQQWGVKIIRLPTGYWNWLDLGQDVTPNGPDDVAARFKNMQRVTPEQYTPYINKVFEWAEAYGMKVFVELHGAPGSQNGEMHSGCITGYTDQEGKKPVHFFDTEFNKQLALQTVGEMAKKCQQYQESCYGVGVLNEPQPGDPDPTDDDLHTFLDSYFGQAISIARQYLHPEVPVVLFSWTYDFGLWSAKHYPEEDFGVVQWDTHIYTPNAASVDEALKDYESDLSKI